VTYYRLKGMVPPSSQRVNQWNRARPPVFRQRGRGDGPGAFVRPTVDGQPLANWDMAWLDQLMQQVFDVARWAALLAVHYSTRSRRSTARYPAVNAVVDRRQGFPFNATDALWSAWKLGERYEVKDPATGTWAVRNVFYDKPGASDTVKALQARGTIFWMCNNALNRLAGPGPGRQRPVEDVRKELIAGLNPGVILIPAHTMLLGLCQERGCTYQLV
jgi:hypothetical protein